MYKGRNTTRMISLLVVAFKNKQMGYIVKVEQDSVI